MKWSFSYGLRLNGEGLSLRDTLAGAGINLGDVLQISISGTYEDLYEKELKEMWAGDKIYMMTTQMLQRREWLQAEVAARKRMTRDDLKKIADSCFAHVDT
jgi:hypothetical protein